MIPDWTLFVLLPAAMGAGVFTGAWLARAGYDNGYRQGRLDQAGEQIREFRGPIPGCPDDDEFGNCLHCDADPGQPHFSHCELYAPELAEPTEQQTMDFLAAVRDDEPGDFLAAVVAEPPRAPRLTAAQRKRAIKKGRIPRDLTGQAGRESDTGRLAGELHHEPPTLERLEARSTLADEIAAATWLRWQLECDAYRDEMAALGLFGGWDELLAGFDRIEIPQLEAA
jgi:hypothetical protein